MPRKRAGALTAVVGTKIYIAGGENQDNSVGGIVDILDTANLIILNRFSVLMYIVFTGEQFS